MAVNLSKLDKYVRQAIESGSATAKHDTGFRVTDSTTGKHYRYVRLQGGVAGVANYPCGMSLVSDDPNIVSCDESDIDCAANVCGQMLGAITDTYYCWIEERDPGMPTDIKTGTAITAGEGLIWTADGYLTPQAFSGATTDDKYAVAIVLSTSGVLALTKIQWM